MRIPPIALPKVKDHHLVGVFGDFEQVVRSRIAQLSVGRHPFHRYKIRLFNHLLEIVSAEKYGEIQARFLGPGGVDPKADTAKYLDPIVWFESKLMTALRLGLHEAPSRQILDLGAGPGHFCFVARFLGHQVVGTEVPVRPTGAGAEGRLFDALCELFEVDRIRYRIEPDTALTGLGGPYDLVTGFLTAFNIDEEKRPWTVKNWRFFFVSLSRNVLKPGGSVYFSLTNNKITPEVWDYLRARSSWHNDTSKAIFFETIETFVAQR